MPKLNFTNSKGFTLIEILVAISILAVVSVITIPGLRSFNINQELDNASQEILRQVKSTQSMGLNGINCLHPTRIYSQGWIMEFRNNKFLVYGNCTSDLTQGSGSATADNNNLVDKNYSDYFSSFNLVTFFKDSSGLHSCSPALRINFGRKDITYDCYGGSFVSSANTQFIIKMYRDAARCNLITIDEKGSIKYEANSASCP